MTKPKNIRKKREPEHKVAFLNGELGFHDLAGHKRYFDLLNSQGVYVMLLDNLFNQPSKMGFLEYYDTIVVGTTGYEQEKLDGLFGMFLLLKYVPERVVFAPKEDPFLRMTRLMEETKFYRLNYKDMSLIQLNYLNTRYESHSNSAADR